MFKIPDLWVYHACWKNNLIRGNKMSLNRLSKLSEITDSISSIMYSVELTENEKENLRAIYNRVAKTENNLFDEKKDRIACCVECGSYIAKLSSKQKNEKDYCKPCYNEINS